MKSPLIIGTDHRGVSLALALEHLFKSASVNVNFFGPRSSAERADYPIVAKEACQSLLINKAIGVLICGNGVGMSMAANKLTGVRAALASTHEDVFESRQKDNANVLCLPGNLGIQKAQELVELFIKTPFAAENYGPRVALLDQIND